MLTELFELMISIWIMVMFFKFLGFVFRAGFRILGWVLGLVGTIVIAAVVISMIGTFVLPILAVAGVIWLIVRLVNPSQSEHV